MLIHFKLWSKHKNVIVSIHVQFLHRVVAEPRSTNTRCSGIWKHKIVIINYKVHIKSMHTQRDHELNNIFLKFGASYLAIVSSRSSSCPSLSWLNNLGPGRLHFSS